MSKQSTDVFIDAQDEMTYLPVSNGIVVAINGPVYGCKLFFNPETLHKLLELSNVCEHAWSTTLKEEA